MSIIDISIKCLLIYYFSTSMLAPSMPAWKQIEKNGMILRWRIENENLRVKVSAPSLGWVAVGFNTKPDLVGTNLIMGAVEEGFYRVDDRYIVTAGDHRAMQSLGVNDKILFRSGFETGNKTTIEFVIPRQAEDPYHIHLTAGSMYHLLLAYSMEDDFEHHSIMRTTIKINL